MWLHIIGVIIGPNTECITKVVYDYIVLVVINNLGTEFQPKIPSLTIVWLSLTTAWLTCM